MIKELKIQAFSFEVPILDTLVIVCFDHNTLRQNIRTSR